MRRHEAAARIRDLLSSADDVAFFFEQLTSPEWLPILEEVGLLGDPPEPVETEGGAAFPFWPASRYLARMANEAPRPVADVLFRVRKTRNPRIWGDTLAALRVLPSAQVSRFVPSIERWVHDPWRLNVDTETAHLVERLASERDETAIALGLSLAKLVPPADWNQDDAWLPLDDYHYGELVPATATRLAAFGEKPIFSLIAELELFLRIQRPGRPGGRRMDLSFIWRPAIEDHEQNWDHDREAKLVRAIRDGLEAVVDSAPERTMAITMALLDDEWPVVRRLGLHLLVDRGDRAPGVVERALTDRAVLDDDHHRHELYRLLARRFAELSPEAKRLFVSNVRSVAAADAEAARERFANEGREVDPDEIRDWAVRRWLAPIAEHLDQPDRDALAAIEARIGEPEAHPDFASYHMSWMGSSSPLTTDELKQRSPDALVDFLDTWKEPRTFGPGPGVDGLRAQLQSVVADDPERFASLAPRFADLDPAYMGGFVNGLQDALKADKTFSWSPVLAGAAAVLRTAFDASEEGRDHTWTDVRMSIARLLQSGLEDKPGTIPFEEAPEAWEVLTLLTEDPEPTPEAEARFGPPNMDPLTYSLNTVRSGGFHALFQFLLWHRRQPGEAEDWSIPGRLPAAADIIDGHLNTEREPSQAVRAAYGWWLPTLLRLDPAWTTERADAIVGEVRTPLERAAWDGFLFAGDGRPAQQSAFRRAYFAFAEQLAALDSKPKERAGGADLFNQFIDQMVLPWLHHPDLRDELPLRTLVASGKAWLVAEVVEEAGRLIGRTRAEQVTPQIIEAYQALWPFILDATANLDPDNAKTALAPFVWWFDSDLPQEWSAQQLLALMKRKILPEPVFPVFRRLPALSAGIQAMRFGSSTSWQQVATTTGRCERRRTRSARFSSPRSPRGMTSSDAEPHQSSTGSSDSA